MQERCRVTRHSRYARYSGSLRPSCSRYRGRGAPRVSDARVENERGATPLTREFFDCEDECAPDPLTATSRVDEELTDLGPMKSVGPKLKYELNGTDAVSLMLGYEENRSPSGDRLGDSIPIGCGCVAVERREQADRSAGGKSNDRPG